MKFDAPIPFTEALDKLAEREVLPSSFDSTIWRDVPVWIRERAFFSSRVESARLLQKMQDYLDDHLANDRAIESHGGFRAHSRAEFVAVMREFAIREGLGRIDPETGEIDPNIRESDLTDIRSLARLQLIYDVQTEAAQEYGYWKQGQDPDVLEVFPAQRFIRVRPVAAPRPWHEAALGEVRRKDDLKFWDGLNRDFGVPWGPWGFNSGCGVEDVDRDEAVELGVMKESDEVRPVEREFNEGLQAGVREMGSGMRAALARVTGGSVAGGVLRARVMPRNTRLDPELVRERIDSLSREDAVDIGLLAEMPEIPPGALVTAEDLRGMLASAGRIFPPGLLRGRRFKVAVRPMAKRKAGSYLKNRITLAEHLLENPAELRVTMLHEVTHAIMEDAPGADAARRKIARHFDRRTRGEEPSEIDNRMYLRDKWWTHHAGLPDGSELASYYVELLGHPPADLAELLEVPAHRETFEEVMEAFGIDWRR